MSQRYFLDSPPLHDRATLQGQEAQHLARVMRAKVGDEVTGFDGSGLEYRLRIEAMGRDRVDFEVLARSEVDRELPRRVTLAVALPKGDRQRFLVEKLVELGVACLVPLHTQRGVAQPTAGAVERLQKGVIEASKQCGRNRLMEIAEPQAWTKLIQAAPAGAARLVAHPAGDQIATPLAPAASGRGWGDEVWAAVGPEGGFTEDERQMALSAGWRQVDLGPRLLRVETAAAALAAWFSLQSEP